MHKSMSKKSLSVFVLMVALSIAVSGCAKNRGNTPAPVASNEATTTKTQNEPQGQELLSDEEWRGAKTIFSSAGYDYSGWKEYVNGELGYKVKYPADWKINEHAANFPDVVFEPSRPENFVNYLTIGLSPSKLEDIRRVRTQHYSEDSSYKPFIEDNVIFKNKKTLYYHDGDIKSDIDLVIPTEKLILEITTSKINLIKVGQMISSFEFID